MGRHHQAEVEILHGAAFGDGMAVAEQFRPGRETLGIDRRRCKPAVGGAAAPVGEGRKGGGAGNGPEQPVHLLFSRLEKETVGHRHCRPAEGSGQSVKLMIGAVHGAGQGGVNRQFRRMPGLEQGGVRGQRQKALPVGDNGLFEAEGRGFQMAAADDPAEIAIAFAVLDQQKRLLPCRDRQRGLLRCRAG